MKRKDLWRRLTALVLGGVMAFSLAACGSTGNETSGGGVAGNESGETGNAEAEEPGEETEEKAATQESGEPTEISIAIWNADAAFAGDDVLSKIEDDLNIKITPMNVTWDDYTQKIQLWAASDSLPDVFAGDFRNSVTYPQWADQGVIKAIPEDLSAYPNLEQYLSGQSAQDAKMNGTLYCIPRQTYPSQEWTCLDRLIYYRWDLAQAAGIEKEPETWEEFQKMILAIIEKDPDGTGIGGMTTAAKGLVNGMIMPYASPIVVDGGVGFKWELDEDGLYKPAYFVEDVVSAFRLARDMYQSGVIEKDIALNTGDAPAEKFLQGKSAAMIISGGSGNKYDTVGRYWKEVHGTEFLDDVKILKLMPDVKGNKSYPVWGYAWSESYISASVSDEKLDKILQLYDYLLSDEGALFSTYGPEGDLYDLVDGKVIMHDDEVLVKDVYPSCDALGVLVRWNPSTYDDRFVSTFPAEYTELDRKQVEEAATVQVPEYNQRCTQILMGLGLDFSIKTEDDFLNIMAGEEPVEEMWAEIYAGYEADGLEDMITQVNEALAAEQ